MKYYHIVYNSSQRTQDGSAGLGIRTYTKGTPKDYMNLLKDNEFFNYTSGDLLQPSPKVLMENGKVILNYPTTYRFAKLFSAETGKVIYVLSRTVSVGFDYPYYVKFVAARVDNFVTDAYVFEEPPIAEVFEMLYETPKEGSVSFIPRDRVPSPENEEMRALSLGEMALLEEEEKPFSCQGVRQVSELAFELLFAYIESCRQRLPLLVKCSATDAPSLMADLIRLLPEDMKKEAFFYTNYQLEGVKEGYKVFFVNEHYKYDYESTGQFYVFDMTQSANIDTEESVTYCEEWKQLFLSGNQDEYFKRLDWVMGSTYELVRGKSQATKRLFFNYLVEPKSFNLNQVYNGDNELLTSLCEYFSKDHSRQQLFDKHLETYLMSDNIKGKDLLSLLKFTDKLESKGFNLDEVIKKAKKAVSGKLLETPYVLKGALDSIGIQRLSKFFDKQLFEGKKAFLETEQLKKDWSKIYKYFYPVAEQNDHVKILAKMLSLNLPESVVDEVIKDFGISDIQLCDCFAEVAKRDASEIDIPYKRIKDIVENLEQKGLELPHPDLAEKIDRYVLTPLMKDPDRPNDIESCHELMQLLSCKFNDQNAVALINKALKLDTRQSASLLFDKGLPFVTEKDADAVVNQIVKNLKPETMKYLVKVEEHRCKIPLLVSYFKMNGDNKKSIEKLRKDGKLRLTDAEFEDLISRLAPAKSDNDDGLDDSGNATMVWMKRLLALVVFLLLVIGCFVLSKTKDDLKLEAFTPTGEFVVKDSITDNTKVPKGAKVGDIFVYKSKKDSTCFVRVIAEQKKETKPLKGETPTKEENKQKTNQDIDNQHVENQERDSVPSKGQPSEIPATETQQAENEKQ